MNLLAFPGELTEFLNQFMLGGVALLVLARALVTFFDLALNAMGYGDIPDENIPSYSVVTSLGILFVAGLGEVLGLAPYIGFEGIVWKILAGLIGGWAARSVMRSRQK